MKRDGLVVTESLDNGMKYRYWLNQISCVGSGAYGKIGADSQIILHNCKQLVDSELNPLTEDKVSGGAIVTSIVDLLTELGVSYEQFAMAWAKITTKEEISGE